MEELLNTPLITQLSTLYLKHVLIISEYNFFKMKYRPTNIEQILFYLDKEKYTNSDTKSFLLKKLQCIYLSNYLEFPHHRFTIL